MILHTNGTHTRTTTSMRNTEGLVEIEMAHIRSNKTRARQTNLCIHVGTIHVHLTSIFVYYVANLVDALFIDSMS